MKNTNNEGLPLLSGVFLKFLTKFVTNMHFLKPQVQWLVVGGKNFGKNEKE
jgi:hypothetical protein